MARKCAYCGESGTLTKEHVWPDCFLERFGRRVAKFSVRGSKVHGADYVVRDVCSECNSTRLSELDAYSCKLYDTYFADLRDFESVVEFEYEFDLLARSLLKIAYNTSRIGVSDPAPLARLSSYMIGTNPRPQRLAIFLELVSPTIVEKRQGSIVTHEKLYPRMFRSALTAFLGPGGDAVLTRIVGVNSFFFHLVVPKEPVLLEAFEEIANEMEKSIQGLARVEPLLKRTVVATSPQDGVSSFVPHMEASHGQYSEYFAREKSVQGDASAEDSR